MLYVKEIIRPKYALKDSTQLPPEGQKGVEIAPHAADARRQVHCRHQPTSRDTASEV